MNRIPQLPGGRQVYDGEFENWSRPRPATGGERFAIAAAVLFCCLLMLAIVFEVLSPVKALATMLLPAGAMLAYVLVRPGRRLRPAYRWAMIAGLAALAGSLVQVHVLSELCFVGLGLDLLVLTFMEKKGLKYE
ncbi:hypothetical protein [Azonexus sp. IMCC34839]|uniref:hypothetical protein n=1 Tax=Azonexus sp. IMCC34839 TaxID=3133695 RepID=UPI00399BCF2E